MENKKGLTLLELVMVITVIVILAGLIFPTIRGMSVDAKVAAILRLKSTLEKASRVYYVDTGDVPRYSGDLWMNGDGASYSPIDGWNGPYLNEPFPTAASPIGGNVYLMNRNYGFDINGNGLMDSALPYTVLVAENVTAEIAQKIDAVVDEGISGSWEFTGWVLYDSNNSTLVILAFAPKLNVK